MRQLCAESVDAGLNAGVSRRSTCLPAVIFGSSTLCCLGRSRDEGERMILRRFIDHVKKEHWTAIAIDFVVVILGVFIGLQANNWNEARNDRTRERTYLERLRADS